MTLTKRILKEIILISSYMKIQSLALSFAATQEYQIEKWRKEKEPLPKGSKKRAKEEDGGGKSHQMLQTGLWHHVQ